MFVQTVIHEAAPKSDLKLVFVCLASLKMPAVTEMIHPRGLGFAMQRKVVILREVRKLSWPATAKLVRNLEGKRPSPRVCRDVYAHFNRPANRVRSKYHNCGRKPWKMTPDVEAYLIRRLKALRTQCVCTSVTLQIDLAKNKGIKVSDSAVRKTLANHGYKWLPRSGNRKYSAAEKVTRCNFARPVTRMSIAALREKLSMSMDGVVIGVPPKDHTDRLNFCRYGDNSLYRKRSERLDPELAGSDDFAKQLPMNRALPLWGGCSVGGFAPILWTVSKKCKVEEWASCVRKGGLTKAVTSLNPVKPRGPWHVVCDNEHFLTSKPCQKAHAKAKVQLWCIPPRSPDLNPNERFD